MSLVSLKWEEVKKSYVEYLTTNVDLVTSIESWTKTLSYLVAGRISKTHSTVIAELLYAASNLFTLLNDHILRKHHTLYKVEESGARRIKSLLAGLEAVEVFIEIAARRYGSPLIKWVLIFCVELIKMIGRFTLLHRFQDGLRYFPIIKRLNRKNMSPESSEGEEEAQPAPEPDQYYTLPNSGRKIKSVSAKYRHSATGEQSSVRGQRIKKTLLTDNQKLAESLHNLQPIVHLGAMAWFGEKSWAPWIASLATDVTSLGMLRDQKYRYTKSEDSELVRRKFVLLMYLLRSPCYDRYTKMRLLRLMGLMSRLPGLGYIMNAIIAYLPEWQSTYFYTWNS